MRRVTPTPCACPLIDAPFPNSTVLLRTPAPRPDFRARWPRQTLTGTIPETDDAPAAVGISYGVGAAAVYVGQLVLGIAVARSRALPGRLRWAPIGVVVLQFPVFIVAGAIGDGIRDETITDGLGMVLTGLLWAGSWAAVWSTVRRQLPDSVGHVSRNQSRCSPSPDTVRDSC